MTNTHGGRREGAGRPRGSGKYPGESTVVMRLPAALAASIRRVPCGTTPVVQLRSGIPVFQGRLPAGGTDLIDERADDTCDVQQWLTGDSVSVVIYTVKGDSMDRAGIFDGDRVVVDRALHPEDGDIVVGFLEGEGHTLKRLRIRPQGVFLEPDSSNPRHVSRPIPADAALPVLGVVTGLVRQLRKSSRALRLRR